MSRSEVVEEVTVKIRRTTTETVEANLTHTESVSALLTDAYTSIYAPITRATFTKVWTVSVPPPGYSATYRGTY